MITRLNDLAQLSIYCTRAFFHKCFVAMKYRWICFWFFLAKTQFSFEHVTKYNKNKFTAKFQHLYYQSFGINVILFTDEILYRNINQTLVTALHRLLNCELDCRVFLKQTIEHVSITYTSNTYFVMHWSISFIQECQVHVLLQYMYDKVRT